MISSLVPVIPAILSIDIGSLTTFAGSLKGKCTNKCLEHSVGPGAVSCSFQLQENGFFNKLEFYCDHPEECWVIAAGLVKETTKIDAGGVKAKDQARQGIESEGYPSDALFFGACASNSSIGVKKLEYKVKEGECGA